MPINCYKKLLNVSQHLLSASYSYLADGFMALQTFTAGFFAPRLPTRLLQRV